MEVGKNNNKTALTGGKKDFFKSSIILARKVDFNKQKYIFYKGLNI